ncbi:nitrate/nitrite two-component system sensor histidine kinase NarX [Edaphovirga cremea]|uniref:nitrate/nitrite two-component system sensor histidine kinase NarX n=1 Tax=Edaphovirga cremea TaxID=2267246 RepID=UPI000DEEB960|nr:nitrate/nitrite two-component system sensor histidine kinase NarX [Edaphovirga cremea]
MTTRSFAPLSIVHQVALLMLLLGLLGFGGMSLSLWMAQSMQGNAHAINKAGSLRMQSYRLLSRVPLDKQSEPFLTGLEQDELSDDLQQSVRRENLTPQFDALRSYWLNTLKPQLQQARQPADAAESVANFVQQLDLLVSSIDQKTEHRLMMVAMVQKVVIVLTLLLLVGTIWYLRRRLLHPWRRLLAQARAVSTGDFSHRYPLPEGRERQSHHEMDTLGMTLNTMSQSLSQMYAELEQRVAEKTLDLQQKNQVLDFLYRASRQLHTTVPLCSRLLPVLNELQTLTPLKEIQIRLYENNNDEQFRDFGSHAGRRPEYCPQETCVTCMQPSPPLQSGNLQPLSWSLHDKLGKYGLVLAQHSVQHPLNRDQQQLVTTLVEQLTTTLALERQSEHQQQLLLMEERSAIARELHDSIAQSLSCLKIQISCLQMQSQNATPENKQLMQQMREELNTAYRQLRELLTTFRLRLTEPGLRAALQATVDEFSARLGFPIQFDYHLPAKSVGSHQAIHVVQIVREALSNIFKHAHASQVNVVADYQQGEIVLRIADNGCGLPEEHQRLNHYGLIIMQDRAHSLHGSCQVKRRQTGGTEVRVQFRPEQTVPH